MAEVQRLAGPRFEGWSVANGSLKITGMAKAELDVDPEDLTLGKQVALTVIGRVRTVAFKRGDDTCDRTVTIEAEIITDTVPDDITTISGQKGRGTDGP